jgi:alkanesulfonate monooxygenase SsuD/methylene tetrahydromethanopterin reductase-like flavin-dependent oxidoreductase (luciferase family)
MIVAPSAGGGGQPWRRAAASCSVRASVRRARPLGRRLAILGERWRRVEELGFDFLFVADHARHTRESSHIWFDGWTTLAAMALETSTIRIGTLVANPILRRPTVLAKAAAAVDHLSEGRLELGIGEGVERFDHDETGSPTGRPRSARRAFASTWKFSTAR